ncbi:Glu/Leu/Phe/Val dehydrogenase [Rhodobacteraceae bacterium SC52]|nr:Glu/Leu/Phe/Val dehydrogenase [Rhodobacteraceae bacterium SC52]
MFDQDGYRDHESVTWISDAATGLRAVIAVHSSALGPAMGGCRLWHYDAPGAALTDALRLSHGMSLKNAMAGLPLGGGKAVILGPVNDAQRGALFEAFGRSVDDLSGRYVTAEDVGVSVADMASVARRTRHVSGVTAAGGVGGDPSPFTARGVLRGIEAAVQHTLGRSDLDGLRVAVQGVGHVGGALCGFLAERGARLIVADTNAKRLGQICDETGAEAVALDDVLEADVDVVAPCALGGAITSETAAGLRAKIVAGAANNQLADPAAGSVLRKRGITYVPDYVINAGGIIAVGAEYLGGGSEASVLADVDAIGPRIATLLAQADADDEAPEILADRRAEQIIASARKAR